MCCGLVGMFVVTAFLALYVAFFGLLGLIVLPVAYFFRDLLAAACRGAGLCR